MRTIVFRALPAVRDSRANRYSAFCSGEFICDTWEEDGQGSDVFPFKRPGRRGRFLVIQYIRYLLYLFFGGLVSLKPGDRVICMELDVFLMIFLASWWRETRIYIDIVDPIAQTKFRKLPFSIVFDCLEWAIIKKHKYVIVPNVNRIDYYEDRLSLGVSREKVLVVENVPVARNVSEVASPAFDIGYFGTLDESRGLKELIMTCRARGLKLLIAGGGPLEDFISSEAEKISGCDFSFLGGFKPSELGALYSQVRFSWAYYTPEVLLHKYASPNKFYEHLAFRTPIITNSIVPMATYVRENKSGVVLPDELTPSTFDDLYEAIKTFNYAKCNFSLWDSLYSNYHVDFDAHESRLA